MSKTNIDGETLLTTSFPDIEKRVNRRSVALSVVLCLMGLGAFIASPLTNEISSTLVMVLLTVGTVLILLAVYRLFWKSKEWVYVPTGSVTREGSRFFDDRSLDALLGLLEKKNRAGEAGVSTKENGTIRMDYVLSADKQFAAVQLFRYVPYTFEIASSVYGFTGKDAESFAHCLEVGKF